jgi:hypothetical protein
MMPTTDTYCIVRNYFNNPGRGRGRVIRRGLTLAQAQAHCHGHEASSTSCTSAAGRQRTRKVGPWFDSFTQRPEPKQGKLL